MYIGPLSSCWYIFVHQVERVAGAEFVFQSNRFYHHHLYSRLLALSSCFFLLATEGEVGA